MLSETKTVGDVLLYQGRLYCITRVQPKYYFLLNSDGETRRVKQIDSDLQAKKQGGLGLDKEDTNRMWFEIELTQPITNVERLKSLESRLQRFQRAARRGKITSRRRR